MALSRLGRILALAAALLPATLVITACSPTVTPVPTQALIPVPPTDTPIPPPPTVTPPPLPGPEDILRATFTPRSPLESGNLLDSDPIAASLVALAQRRIAEQLDLPIRRVLLVEATPIIWTDNSLGCPQPGQTYTPVQIDGYRIVVAVGDTQYIFHTDFDRLMPCDAGDERIPGTATPTE